MVGAGWSEIVESGDAGLLDGGAHFAPRRFLGFLTTGLSSGFEHEWLSPLSTFVPHSGQPKSMPMTEISQ